MGGVSRLAVDWIQITLVIGPLGIPASISLVAYTDQLHISTPQLVRVTISNLIPLTIEV